MKKPPSTEDQLLANLLRQVDTALGARQAGDHLDDEILALFAAGALAGADRQQTIQHLDACPSCRRAASLLIAAAAQSEDEDAVPPEDGDKAITGQKTTGSDVKDQVSLSRVGWSWLANRRSVAWAIAAVLLVAVGSLVFWPGADSSLAEAKAYKRALAMLEQSRFDDAQQAVAQAGESGIESDRLRSLEAEAVRQIPAPVALAYAGRLSDFGYDIGGVVARDPTSLPHRAGLRKAEQILQAAGQENLEVILNRGHALLSLDRAPAARAEFQRATDLAPRDPLAWLGLGLAYFMTDDFEAAETAFRQAVSLDPKNISAGVNLAMTLDEKGQTSAAIAQWRHLLEKPLSEQERKRIEITIDELESRTKESEPRQ